MKIGVVGAGPGSLAAADLLASYGFNVTIHERKDMVGGRNTSFKSDKYTFDSGPTFFIMDFILREIFKECDRDLEDYVDVVSLNPYYQIIYGDGSKLKMGPDKEKVKESISKFNASDAENLENFLEDNDRKLSKTLPALQRGYYKFTDIFSKEVLNMLPVLRPFSSLWDDLGRHFDNKKVKLGFTFQSKYLGMSPYNCPSMFSIISYIEHKWDVHHIMGGLNQLSIAMSEVFKEFGGDLRLNSEVEEILIENGEAKGFLLDDGSREEYDEIIMGSDFAWSMKNLIPESKRKKYTDKKLDSKKYSCSTFMLYLGLDRLYENIEHHNIFIPSDYEKNLREIESEKVLPDDPSFYLQNPSVTDPSLAPEGHSTLYVLVPVPNLKGDVDWDKEKNSYRDLIIDKLVKRGNLENLEDHIDYEKVLTPDNWKEDMNVGYGATFNLAHNIRQMLIFRPRNKFEEFDNMWLVGGGTNPGSGLPTIYESGRIAAHRIKDKYGK